MIGPYFTGQRPAEPLVIAVTTQNGQARSLTGYSSVEFLLKDSSGNPVDVSAGSATIADAANGVVSFVWPTTSVLTQPGDYKYQIKLVAGDSIDYTSIDTFEVYEGLGG